MGDWSIAVNPAQRDAYLSRLGFTEIPQVSVETLYAVHRAQVERVPYETLWIKYGELRTIDPAASVAVVTGPGGRGGYCYHLNGAFGVLLDWLGFDVRRHITGVQGHKDDAPHLQRNHLAVTVHGLPAPGNPDGVWFIDAGLGDGTHEPIPLVYNDYQQGPFTYRLRPSELDGATWRFDHDKRGSFLGIDAAPPGAATEDFQAKHEWLATSPESGFAGPAVVCLRDATGIDELRGCMLRRIDADGEQAREVSTRADWFAALADMFGVTLDDLDDARRDRLWDTVSTAHAEWLASRS